jgi:hypothetical protein
MLRTQLCAGATACEHGIDRGRKKFKRKIKKLKKLKKSRKNMAMASTEDDDEQKKMGPGRLELPTSGYPNL